MTRRHWKYADAEHCKVGMMICISCKKDIVSGQYKYRETKDAYLPIHRDCSNDDQAWSASDKLLKKTLAIAEAGLVAHIEFAQKWSTDSLDEDIAYYKKEVHLMKSKIAKILGEPS